MVSDDIDAFFAGFWLAAGDDFFDEADILQNLQVFRTFAAVFVDAVGNG